MSQSELKPTECPCCGPVNFEKVTKITGSVAEELWKHVVYRNGCPMNGTEMSARGWNYHIKNRRADAKAERLLEAARRMVSVALNTDGEHVEGLIQLDNAANNLARAVEDFEKGADE